MANLTITNLNQLNLILIPIIKECLNEVGQKVENLLKEHVDSDVYAKGNRTNYYAYGTTQPTFDLRESIKKLEVKSSGNEASISIGHDKDRLRFDPDNFVHGSRYWKDGTTDIREYLPIIIDMGLSGDLFGNGWWQDERPYFRNTLKELRDSGKLREWFIAALKKQGIKVV